jgi:signal transduction histidine kinase
MDITAGRPGPAPARPVRRVPWSPRAWNQVVYLAAGIPVQLLGGLLIVGLIAWSGMESPHVLRIGLIWLAGTVVLLLLSPMLTRVQRHRLRATAGVDILPQPRRGSLLNARGLAARLRSQSTWRQLAYHGIVAPLLAVAAAIAVAVWPVSLLLIFTFAFTWSNGHPELGRAALSGHQVINHPYDIALTLAGVALLLLAPWLTRPVRALDARAGRALLGPSRADELAYRVEQLTETRAGVVDAADAERRRLERDLHDGTQQRLVSLAMNLGMARARASTAEEARQAIAAAHEEAKAALAELRDLIRGLHPAVLEDRGLDAALSGVAARMPIPVRLTVDLPRRPAPVIEAVAYFVVSEGLANIAKHAQAREVAVSVERVADRLHVIVTDDGVGGADPARGTGLAGLARRAASVDGIFEIDSPPGGPTLLTVDLPCNR